MASRRRPALRNNAERWSRSVSVYITKELQAIADDTGVNLKLVIRDELDKLYKANLIASYGARSRQGNDAAKTHKIMTSTYHKTGTLLEAVDTVIEDKYVKVVLDSEKTYDDGKPATEVYSYLINGTMPSKYSVYQTPDGKWHRNYPTPAHLFEQHTNIQIKGFLSSLSGRIANGEYTTYRYTGKKKKRTTYQGHSVE